MDLALQLWAQLPTETEAALSRYHGRRIREWHVGTMSSRELLSLLCDLPEHSAFRTRVERTHRLVEVDGRLRLYSVLTALPPDARIECEFVDWTHDRKIAARTALEIASLREDGTGTQPSRDGLNEPLIVALQQRERQRQDAIRSRSRSAVLDAIDRGKRGE